jgi:DNA polymerase III subunit epsilon
MTTPTPWWDDLLVAFDLETTSADPEVARIVTAHVSLVDREGGAEGRTLILDPECDIPAEAAAVHGFTTERAREEGMARRFGVGALWALLGRFVGKYPVVAFNAAFDFTVLDREARRMDLAPIVPRPVIDPLVLDKAVDTYRRGSRKLTAVAAHYGVPLLDAHDAGSDALAAVGVARAIGRKYQHAVAYGGPVMEDVPVLSPDVETMHDWQVEYREQQARSLEKYFRRTDPDAVVDPTWPVHPFTTLHP